MRLLRASVLFAVLLAFWLILSGQYNPLFIGMGVVSAAACAWFGALLVEPTVGDAGRHPRVHLFWLVIYVGWLLSRMVVGAMQVAWIVLNPKHPPRPGILRFRTELASPAARTMLANSITLVPGTITLEIDDGVLTVHSFTPKAVDDLASARMQNRIAAVFRDVDQPKPQLDWEFGDPPSDTDPGSREAFDPDAEPR